MYIIIIGCGRLGGNLAKELADNGHDVCVVDRDADRLGVLGSGFNGRRIKGVEFDGDNLVEAGVRQADALLAVTPDDNINITVSMIAEKIYQVPKIIARVNDPGKKYIYDKLSIKTINPVQLGAEMLKNRLAGKNLDVIAALDQEYEIIELFVCKDRPAAVEDIEQRYSCVISAVKRDGNISLPQKDQLIRPGDRILCTVRKKDKGRLMNSFAKEKLL